MPAQNPTTKERLAANRRHLRFWRFITRPAKWWTGRKFNFTFDDAGSIEGPYLVLCNHVTNYDPILVGLTLHNQAYFVAAENVLHKGFASRMLMRYFCPIIHQKGQMGLRSAKEMQQTLKAGSSVVLFPEGNRCFAGLTEDIPPVTAKIAKKAGKLVCLRLEGGYLTQPRWGTTLRKGQLHCRLANVYDAEQLKAMTDEEVLAAIREDLFEDAFARQRELGIDAPDFEGEHLALGLESALFMCPDCEGISTLRSDDEGIFCTSPGCRFHTDYTPQGFFDSGRFTTVAEWDAWQQEQLAALMTAHAPGETLFADDITLHLENSETPGRILGLTDGIFFQADGKDALHPLTGFAIFSRNTIVAQVGNPAQSCTLTGDMRFNALKYRYLYHLLDAHA